MARLGGDDNCEGVQVHGAVLVSQPATVVGGVKGLEGGVRTLKKVVLNEVLRVMECGLLVEGGSVEKGDVRLVCVGVEKVERVTEGREKEQNCEAQFK